MKRLYEISFEHKKYNNDRFEPFVIAENIETAIRKAKKWLKVNQKAKLSSYRLSSISEKGTIEVE